ncbi:MAG: hypothetical protein LBI13_03575 [Streptococcaceae bacterium]|jgi:hypothetical protein|nr:hypothetical protein [Streptococcaceae bacterium]
MKSLTKVTSILAISLLALGLITQVSAAEKKDNANTPAKYHKTVGSNLPFEDLNDSDSVLILPDGGMLHGKIQIVDKNDSKKILATYNSDSNSTGSSTTVANVRQKLKSGITPTSLSQRFKPANSTIAVIHPLVYNDLWGPGTTWSIELSLGAVYSHTIADSGITSNGRGWSGWYFAEHSFWPVPGTGAYLRWRTYADSGRVGDDDDAASLCYYGIITGIPLYVEDGYRYFTGIDTMTTYFSYMPYQYAVYEVANI